MARVRPEVEPYNPYRFNSKRWDPATSSYDMGFRDYSPGLNRFLTRDMYNGALADLKLGTDPWNTNRYAFAGGNPVTGIETDGHRNEMEYYGRVDRSGGTAVTQRLGSRDVTAEEAGDFSAAYEVAASKLIGEGGGQGHQEIVGCNSLETWKVENGRKTTCGWSDVQFSNLFAEEMCRQSGIVCGAYTPTGEMGVGLGHDSGAVRFTGGLEAPTGRRAMGGGYCSFSGETKVLMADGSVKPISEVKVGDMVMATDPDTGERGPREVTKLWVHEDTVVDLEVDGTVVTTTEDHPFWNSSDGEFERADVLDRGDQLLAADGRTVRVGGIRPGSQRTATAYNLTVDDIHTYYVLAGNTPVLVHNFGCDVPAPSMAEKPLGPSRPAGTGDDWVARTADNGKGQVWQAPGATGNADMVRVMNATDRYPNGYVRFYNKYGQPIGLDGKPGSRAETHIPMNPYGAYPLPVGW